MPVAHEERSVAYRDLARHRRVDWGLVHRGWHNQMGTQGEIGHREEVS